MSEITERAQAAEELFEELLNGCEAEKAHNEMQAGARLFGRVSKRLFGGKVIHQAWPHFEPMTVAELHSVFMDLQDQPRAEVERYFRDAAKGDAA